MTNAPAGLIFSPAGRDATYYRINRTILARIYTPAAYYRRVREVMRLLDRTPLEVSTKSDPLPRRLLGIAWHDLVLLWRLVRRITLRQPAALWPFCRTFWDIVRKNPRAVDYVGMLAAVYLHLGPFIRFVIATVDRQIAEIDAGTWRPDATVAPVKRAPVVVETAA